MIKLIIGKKGSGKTKLLIESANDHIKKAKGHIAFIDYDNSHMLQVDYRIRFITTKDYSIKDGVGFFGFLCGIIASNYDIETIYVDHLYNITQKELADLNWFFKQLDQLDLRFNINFVIGLDKDLEELPDYLKKYMKIEL
ncbi:conserved hypothetical protein [Alkaliphilus metalliredigens QYMF]|uniref:ATP-binding protein n=1 Tax=Alkaliphilus metalliredigens (strain QYMF) TaxID=293826 RepID=A6TUD3_ALKMQ|nr:hypothetical protein [Alkaliphilus metalliredigens]ABR49801.1 conserved hypothetical protein [Alkaliphilus metalliredigens QYMF]